MDISDLLGAFLGHEVLLLGSRTVGLRHLVLGLYLVVLLRAHHPLLLQPLHALVALPVHLLRGLRLLPHLARHLHLLAPRPVARFPALRRRRVLGRRRLQHLGVNLSARYVRQRVAAPHALTLRHIDGVYMARHHVAHAILRRVSLTAHEFLLGTYGQQAHQGHYSDGHYHHRQSRQKRFACLFHNSSVVKT